MTPSLAAQCSTLWLPGQGVPGVVGGVGVGAVINVDPDGAGPAPRVVVCGGAFKVVGSVAAENIATFDATTGAWSTLGTGVDGRVLALTTLPNGSFVAAGEFTMAGGVVANHVARWDGTSWSPLGTGTFGTGILGGTVYALTTLPNGDVVAGGTFTFAGGAAANNIARWDGTSWSPLGTGMDGGVYALTTLSNGDVVAGGFFTTAGGVTANNIARWNGTTWSPLGTGVDQRVNALTTLANGDVVAGGRFGMAGAVAARRIARWNGTVWSPLGVGFSGYGDNVAALTTLPNGDLVAGGGFPTAGGLLANGIARWNGAAWSPLGSGMLSFASLSPGSVAAMTVLPNGNLVAGGYFAVAGGIAASNVARWNGTAWSSIGSSAIGSSVNDWIYALTTLPNGDVVAGGAFTTAGGVVVNGIARWNGTSWSALGTGVAGAVYALATLPNGDVVAGGMFTTAGGVLANNIARWNGTSWSALDTGIDPDLAGPGVAALTALPNGDVVAGGWFTTAGGLVANNIARWDGTSWSPLGTGVSGIPYASVGALTTLSNGDVVAGGFFTTAGGVLANNIARWNGTTWSPLGTGTNDAVAVLTALPNGDLVAGGVFTTAGGLVAAKRIARWDGTTWSALGTGMAGGVGAITRLPNGDLVVGGFFAGTAGGVIANRIARWNGTAWSALGTGIDSNVRALTMLPNDDVAAGGDFLVAGASASVYFARLTTTCPATVASQGVGCTGSGGPNVITATALPWIGATFRARGTGMPSLGLVVAVTGLTAQSLPLSSLLPQGQPGCTLLVSPDLLDVLLPVAGIANSQLVLPNTPSLVGQSFRHQLVPLELDPSSAITAITSTNALTATIGVF